MAIAITATQKKMLPTEIGCRLVGAGALLGRLESSAVAIVFQALLLVDYWLLDQRKLVAVF